VLKDGLSVNILGLVYTSHDAGLALLTGGKPNIILEEERFNRIKHTLKYPRMAMESVFGVNGPMNLSDVDVITTPWDMKRIRRSLLGAVFGQMPASLNLLRPEAHRTHTTGLLNVPLRLRLGLYSQFGLKKLPPIIQVPSSSSHRSKRRPCSSPTAMATMALQAHGLGVEIKSRSSGQTQCLTRLACSTPAFLSTWDFPFSRKGP
jgi:predicted NodU family carbamoyl transferase